MMTSPNIGNIANAIRETCRITSTREALSECANLTGDAGLRQFVVYHDILPVGRKTSSAHSHSTREEFVLVLAGTLTLWTDGQTRQLQIGDYVALAAGTGVKHYMYNEGPSEVQYMMVATMPPDDVISYSSPISALNLKPGSQ
jgi:uncharacterized cupin superfamily protein